MNDDPANLRLAAERWRVFHPELKAASSDSRCIVDSQRLDRAMYGARWTDVVNDAPNAPEYLESPWLEE